MNNLSKDELIECLKILLPDERKRNTQIKLILDAKNEKEITFDDDAISEFYHYQFGFTWRVFRAVLSCGRFSLEQFIKVLDEDSFRAMGVFISHGFNNDHYIGDDFINGIIKEHLKEKCDYCALKLSFVEIDKNFYNEFPEDIKKYIKNIEDDAKKVHKSSDKRIIKSKMYDILSNIRKIEDGCYKYMELKKEK